jgi:hypothetical protein
MLLVPKGLLFREAGGHSIQSIQVVIGIQDRVPTAARTAGKQGEMECLKTRSEAWVKAFDLQSEVLDYDRRNCL